MPTARSASLTVALALGLVASGCGGTRTVTIERGPPAPTAQGDQRLYGHITAVTRVGDHFELSFDPVWFLSGITANAAQAADQGLSCRPAACPPVANDNYRVEEGHRVLVFVLPAGVHGTVLVKRGAAGGPFPVTTITAAELARLVAGKSRLKLFEPLDSGVWILVHIDTVRAFAQQYVP